MSAAWQALLQLALLSKYCNASPPYLQTTQNAKLMRTPGERFFAINTFTSDSSEAKTVVAEHGS